jgi:ABC-type Zn2+ transport system substrate-binding protein/surface adhesin
VFSEAQFSPKLTETLAEEAGVQANRVRPVNDSLGEPPADSYIGMMTYHATVTIITRSATSADG